MQFPYSIKIKALDEATGVFKKINKNAQVMSKSFKKIGQDLTFKVTAPIVGLGTLAVRNFIKQKDAIDQVAARLKVVGNTVGITQKQFEDAAAEMQLNSLFGDEEILRNVTTQLLTFTNITNKQLMGTQQAILDIATVTNQDLKSTAIQLGKALNDPVANLGALTRSGIQFSKSQRAVIKALAESGQLAEAQNLILKELKNQYGGAAKAAALSNPYKKLALDLGDLSEKFGELIHEFLVPLLNNYIIPLVQKISRLSSEKKKLILVITGITAAVGPLLIAIGLLAPIIVTIVSGLGAVATAVTSLIPILATLFTTLSPFLFNPITGTIVGIAAAAFLIVKNWKPISNFFKNLWTKITSYFMGAYEKIKPIIDLIRKPFSKKDNEFKAEQVITKNMELEVQKLKAANFENKNSVAVDFTNVPRGTNIYNKENSSMVSLNVGYALPEAGF